jgi:hypothetical protein
VSASTTVEAATTAKSTTAVETATAESAAADSTTNGNVIAAAVRRTTSTREPMSASICSAAAIAADVAAVASVAATHVSAATGVSAVSVITGVTVIAGMTVVAMSIVAMTVIRVTPTPSVPGTNADEDAANKPGRSVIAIRSAAVWIVRVITPRAIRRSIVHRSGNNGRPNADSHRDLSIRRKRKRQSKKHCDKYEF